MPGSMEGRTAVVFGVANKRSIAWAIAQALQAAGARLVITYQNERLAEEARDLSHAMKRSSNSSPSSRRVMASCTRWCTASPSPPPTS
jgi:enoyl-[acyl-carrier protein] reductase I